MSGMLRSKAMKYCSILMPHEVSNQAIQVIGEEGCFHVEDLGDKLAPSKDAQLAKKRLVEVAALSRKLEHFEDQMKEFKVTVPMIDGSDLMIHGDVLEAFERFITPVEEELVRNIHFQREQRKHICEALEHKRVLEVCRDQGLQDRVAGMEEVKSRDPDGDEEGGGRRRHDNSSAPLLASGSQGNSPALSPMQTPEQRGGQNGGFRTFVCGMIAQSQQPLFQRMLYRVSRGNAISGFDVVHGGVEDPSGERVPKSVFYIMLIGAQLNRRVTKMCALFDAKLYDTPSSAHAYAVKIRNLNQELATKRDVLLRTEQAIEGALRRLAVGDSGASPLRDWQVALHKEAEIAGTMMKCHFYATMLCMEGWCPSEDVQRLQDSLSHLVKNTRRPLQFDDEPRFPLHKPKSPPTYFKTNKFTSVYQGIVDTYGVGRYQEMNPALFTIVTFPFLFGVMYGDIGHGCLLFLAALWMIVNEKKLLEKKKNKQMGEIFEMTFGGRYMLIMMAFFAVYVGTLYNDCMAVPIAAFDSMWEPNEAGVLERVQGRVYPWGVDWGWYNKKNQLLFFNSLKMKLSVVLGVTQMLFGLFLSLANHIFFKDWVSVWLMFVPQLVFLSCTFGYMVVIIIYKWCVDWSATTAAPPNLVQTMISMFLSPGSVDTPLYQGQASLQVFLLLLAFISVPIMLLGKPLANKKKAQRARARARSLAGGNPYNALQIQGDYEDEEKSGIALDDDHEEDEEEAHGFSDDMIHSFIHTIEFVLGCVSNTASYLRLWALSLAHAQLAQVFWDRMMMQYGINTGSAIFTLVGFAMWAVATFCVLLVMDVLECFLHALRLHWVEFQNKFYYADGYKFKPFSFVGVDKD